MQAAEKLKITATELCKLQIADGVIPVMISFTVISSSHFSSLLLSSLYFYLLCFSNLSLLDSMMNAHSPNNN